MNVLEIINAVEIDLRLPKSTAITQPHAALLLGYLNTVQRDLMTENTVWDELKQYDTLTTDINVSTITLEAADPGDTPSQYIKHSLATAINDFLVASGVGAFVKKTLAEVKGILGLGTAAYTNLIDEDDMVSDTDGQAPTQQSVKAYVDAHSGGGGGDMFASVYDPGSVAANAFNVDNHIDGTTNKVFTGTEKTKLSGIEAGADITDATNGAAAGAFMATNVVDEDNFVSNSDTKVPTQQSVKAYVDAHSGGGGGAAVLEVQVFS